MNMNKSSNQNYPQERQPHRPQLVTINTYTHCLMAGSLAQEDWYPGLQHQVTEYTAKQLPLNHVGIAGPPESAEQLYTL